MCSQRLYLEEPDIFPFFPLRECFFREFYAPAWLTRMPKNLLHSLFKIRIILAKWDACRSNDCIRKGGTFHEINKNRTGK